MRGEAWGRCLASLKISLKISTLQKNFVHMSLFDINHVAPRLKRSYPEAGTLKEKKEKKFKEERRSPFKGIVPAISQNCKVVPLLQNC